MVARLSEALNLDVGGSGAIQQSGVGMKKVDVGQFATQHDTSATESPDNSAERILGVIGNFGATMGQKVFKAGTEEAYMQGVAQAGTIQNEEALQSNILTKDWATAGYRDTMGRLKSADLEAQRTADMVKMREKSPEDYQAYLAEQRGKLMPQLEGMSREARGSLLAQSMLAERASIKRHGSEHTKFIVETEEKGVRASIYSSINTMEAVMGDENAEVYQSASAAAHASLYQNIVANPRLPEANKVAMLKEAAGYALQQNHIDLYNRIAKTSVPIPGAMNPDGTQAERPMMTMLSFEDSAGLSDKLRSAMDRTEVFRGNKFAHDKGLMEASFSDPNAPIMSHDEVGSFINKGVQDGHIKTRQEAESIWQKWATASAKKDTELQKAAAFQNGDMGAILKLNSNMQEGLDAWVNINAKKMSVPEMSAQLIQIGSTKGQSLAFKKVGELYAMPAAQLGDSEHVNLENAVLMTNLMKSVQDHEKSGAAGAMMHLMSAFPEATQAKLMALHEKMKVRGDAGIAAKEVFDDEVKMAKLTPQQKAVMANGNAKEDQDLVATLTPQTWYQEAGRRFHSMFPTRGGKEAGLDADMLPKGTWWGENTRASEEAASTYRLDLLSSASRIRMERPDLTSESVIRMAKADASKRTVMTESGPLLLPYGTDLNKKFNVNEKYGNVSNDRIGMALSEMYKPAKGNSARFSFDAHGELNVREYNEAGEFLKAQRLDSTGVGAVVNKQREREAEKFAITKGPGIARKDSTSGLSVQFNGMNTFGAKAEDMFDLRESLVKHEGVRDTPYEDLSGKVVDGKKVQTVGVGVSSHNKFYPKPGADGKVSQDQIADSFKLASNDAGDAASRVMKATGIAGKPAFMLFGELAYQSGTGFDGLRSYGDMIKGIKAQDYSAAQAALEASPAWKWSQPERRSHYSAQLKSLMKG